MSRILIADDEVIECRALEMMLRNDFPEEEALPFAVNGPDLIAKIEKDRPDLAVVDINMPGMTGLEALELVHMRNPGMKIIVCTAYSDYEYLRQAMQLGASDYLLKPVRRPDFQKAVRRVLDELRREQERSKKDELIQGKLAQMDEVVGNEFLASLLLGEPNRNSFKQYVDSLHQEYRGTVMLLITGTPENGAGKRVKLPRQQIAEELRKYCKCISRSYGDGVCVLVFPGKGVDQENLQSWLEDILQMTSRVLQSGRPVRLDTGVSGWKLDVEDMACALDECRIAMQTAGESGIHFYSRLERKSEQDPLREAFLDCRRFLKNGEQARCVPRLKEAFEKPETISCSLDGLKAYILRDLPMLMEKREGARLARYQRDNRIRWDQLSGCGDILQVKTWLLEQLGKVTEMTDSRPEEHVTRALLYMEENYGTDISLEQAAGSAGISSFYLSRLLKQETGKTFVELLTEIRMSRAMVLLQEQRYPVKEIAQMTGYPNVTYFYKTFKKYTGMNVGELKRLWELPEENRI